MRSISSYMRRGLICLGLIGSLLYFDTTILKAQELGKNNSKKIMAYFHEFAHRDFRKTKWKRPVTAIIYNSDRWQIDLLGQFLEDFHLISNHPVYLTKNDKAANLLIIGVDNIKGELVSTRSATYKQFFNSAEQYENYVRNIKKSEMCTTQIGYLKNNEIGSAYFLYDRHLPTPKLKECIYGSLANVIGFVRNCISKINSIYSCKKITKFTDIDIKSIKMLYRKRFSNGDNFNKKF